MRVSPTTAQEHSSSRQRVLWLFTFAFTFDALSVIDVLKTQNAQHFDNVNRLMELADRLADADADLDLIGFLKGLLEEYWNFEASVSAF